MNRRLIFPDNPKYSFLDFSLPGKQTKKKDKPYSLKIITFEKQCIGQGCFLNPPDTKPLFIMCLTDNLKF